MSSDSRSFAVVDLECTCSNVDAGDDSVVREDMETIEIGAVIVRSDDFAIVDRFERFARPTVHRELTAFCTALTSITQAQVDAADPFPAVFRAWLDWLEAWSVVGWGSWGKFDAHQLVLDAQRHGIESELERMPPHANIKSWWSKRMRMPRAGLASAVAQAGLDWQGRAHRGIDDARNIARLLPYVGWPHGGRGTDHPPGQSPPA